MRWGRRSDAPRTVVPGAAVGAALLLLATACSGSAASTTPARTRVPAHPTTTIRRPTTSKATAAPLTKSAIKALAEKLFPPAPTPAGARVAARGCMANMEAGLNVPEDTAFRVARGADGSYERIYGGKNPRVEVSRIPFDTPPTPAQQAASQKFVAAVAKVVAERGWDDPANAVRDGFRPMQECNSHLVNIDAVLDGRDLDPEHPEFLVFEPGLDGKNHLRSVMFMASTNTGHGPQAFGPLAIWHYHYAGSCMIQGILEIPQDPGTCPAGTKRYARTPEMLHVSFSGPPFSPAM